MSGSDSDRLIVVKTEVDAVKERMLAPLDPIMADRPKPLHVGILGVNALKQRA